MAKPIKIIVSGIELFDGEYEIDADSGFTNRELNIIKRISGVRAGELEEALEAGDNDLIVAITAVAIRQANRNWEEFEKLAWDATAGSITLPDDDGDAEVPVPLDPPTLPPAEETGEPPPPTGDPSSDVGGDPQATNLPPIGDLRSVSAA